MYPEGRPEGALPLLMKWVGKGQLGGAVEGPPWGTSS